MVDDLIMTIDGKQIVKPKYLDISLSYVFDTQAKIDKIVKAMNAFVEEHNDGLERINYNILGYSAY